MEKYSDEKCETSHFAHKMEMLNIILMIGLRNAGVQLCMGVLDWHCRVIMPLQ